MFLQRLVHECSQQLYLESYLKTGGKNKLPSRGRWIDKLWYIHTKAYLLLSNKKKHTFDTSNNIEDYQNCYTK